MLGYWLFDLIYADDESGGLFSDKPWFGLSGWLVFGTALVMVFVSEYFKKKMNLMLWILQIQMLKMH